MAATAATGVFFLAEFMAGQRPRARESERARSVLIIIIIIIIIHINHEHCFILLPFFQSLRITAFSASPHTFI